MKSPFYFIVKPKNDRRYDSTKNIGGIDFITSTSEENHMASNREGIVISTPLGYKGDVEPGDTLLVHHNVFKFYNDMYGRRKSGKSYFKENLFFIDDDQFFLYKKEGKWKSHGKYCFVKPILVEKSIITKNTKYEPLKGIVKYSNKQLELLGVNEGDVVIFTPESEYEFTLEDEVLYRMFTNNITTVLENG